MYQKETLDVLYSHHYQPGSSSYISIQLFQKFSNTYASNNVSL